MHMHILSGKLDYYSQAAKFGYMLLFGCFKIDCQMSPQTARECQQVVKHLCGSLVAFKVIK